MASKRRIAALVGLLVLCLAAVAAQGRRRSRCGSWRRVEAGAAVCVGDVAEVVGPRLIRLRRVVVVGKEDIAKVAGSARVELSQVRAAIERNSQGESGAVGVFLGRRVWCG